MERESLLLHTCCAPCFVYVHDCLKGEHEVTAFFFNPNIAPEEEYRTRLDELTGFADRSGFPLIVEPPDHREWLGEVKAHRFDGERSERCRRCFRFRLERTFLRAREMSFRRVGTVLTVSPHKDPGDINRIGRELERRYGIEFLEADFKKNNGFYHSVRLSKLYGFYRQDYCGCEYSKMERNRTSPWNRKARAVRDASAAPRAGT
ncbi:MAG: epoxyqueuosine reductase QueH [Spirochaetes bacterium]|nr:epoxyqueuosine reductase QueH [Spirochaetota bacterium]